MTPPDDHGWRPATFQERGVAVPFTSPALAGARVRVAERSCDLLMPHPGGARGIYVLALPALTEFCSPTLHDLRLAGRLAALRPLSPASVRSAALAVAAEGAAGRAACLAAQAAIARDVQARRWHERTFLAGARAASRDGAALEAEIGALSAVLVDAGLHATGASPGRCSLVLDSIDAVGRSMATWAEATCPGAAGSHVADRARLIVAIGRQLMAASRRMLDDTKALLDAWARLPDLVAASLGRVAWLLDGWDHLCLLWQMAELDDLLAEAATEIRALMPPIPPEVETWLDDMPDLWAAWRACAPTAFQAWRRPPGQPSQAVALIARNERLRALAA